MSLMKFPDSLIFVDFEWYKKCLDYTVTINISHTAVRNEASLDCCIELFAFSASK